MKIAIVKLSSLGDIIHGLISCQVIKKYIPNSQIHWFVENRFVAILEQNPLIDRVYPLTLKPRKHLIRIARQLSQLRALQRTTGYDYVIDLQGLLKSAIVARLLGHQTYGFDAASAREPMAARLYRHAFQIDYQENIIIRNLSLLSQSLGIELTLEEMHAVITDKQPFLFFSNADLETAQQALIKKNTDLPKVVLIPNASTGERVLGVSFYHRMIEQIEAQFYVCWGDPAAKIYAQQIQDRYQNVSILPRLTLPELVAFFSLCDLSIGPDTGPANIMFGLNKRSLTIYRQDARNSAERNTLITETNQALTFTDLANIPAKPVVEVVGRLL